MVDRYYLTFVRHGESTGNAQRRYQGQGEYPLTELGREQARLLAERFLAEGSHFDRIFTSPLGRARETAEIIAAALGAPVELDPIWMERHLGELSGLTPEVASQSFPHPAYVQPFHPVGETGESEWELYQRAGRAVQGLLRLPSGSYLVVTHGGLLNMVLYVCLGIASQVGTTGPRFILGNTAVSSLMFDPNRSRWYIEAINDGSHCSGLQASVQRQPRMDGRRSKEDHAE